MKASQSLLMGNVRWDEEVGLWNQAAVGSFLAFLIPHRAL